MLAVKGGSYAIGSESTSLPFQDSDDILQPVNIFRYFYLMTRDIVVCPYPAK